MLKWSFTTYMQRVTLPKLYIYIYIYMYFIWLLILDFEDLGIID